MNSNNINDYSIFTVCNINYLPKALVLAKSLNRYNKKKLIIFIIDKKINMDFNNFDAEIYWIEDEDIPNFYELAFKYDIIELSTSLKPYITIKLLKQYEKVIYFDADICLYSSIEPILNDLEKHSIVLTPHYTTPQSDDLSESDLGMMRFGSYNLGFYAVKNNQQGLLFLNWWSKRCFQLSYMETQFGLSTDQKWVSIAPCFIKDIYVSFNLGYNCAAWNSFERFIKKDKEQIYWVNDVYRLVFFHFSHFDKEDLEYLKKRALIERNIKRPDLLELGINYNNELILKESQIGYHKYAFDYMSGGEYISLSLRRAYASIKNMLPTNHDPFDSDGIVAKFAKKNFLFERKNARYIATSYKNIIDHKNKMRIIYSLMRMILRFIGPNKFFNFSRLLVFLSSYRQNTELWKYKKYILK